MGMFDKPQYLTGNDNPFAKIGETFWLHNAKVDGEVTVAGDKREQVKLLVSKTKDGPASVVFTAGMGVVNQVKRIDDSDLKAMPYEVRLDQIPSGKGNPTTVLTPADRPPASTGPDADIPF
jgi:hypothetical protein